MNSEAAKDQILEIPALVFLNVFPVAESLTIIRFPLREMGLMIVAASWGGWEAGMKEGMGSTQYREGHAARDPQRFDFTNISQGEINSPTKGQAQKE